MTDLDLPPEIEEYRVIRLLGSGAMGHVYLAQDRLLDRLVAIKFIAAATPSARARQRFFTEARAAARITHENVVSVYRVAEFRRQPFLVSEYVRGQALAELTRPVGPELLVRLATGLARGLAAAHRRGVLHRDIKPANAIMSEEGMVKLLDFGLAELVGDATEPAKLAGTPVYMAPELWDGAAPSPRSDIFALGVLLFELCCGVHPFDHAHGNQAASRGQPLHTLVDTPDLALCRIIERCIAHDPLLRWADGEALCEALDALAMPAPLPAAIPEGSPYRGLLAFDGAHRNVFFGRSSEARAIRERLRGERMVVVAGDSGTGKSSLVRAGVLPLFETESAPPVIATVVLGRSPLRGLAAALAPLLGDTEDACVERLAEQLAEVSRDLRATGREIILFVDQLEELVTQASGTEREAAADALAGLVHGHAVRLIGTARSDFLTRLAALRGLGDDLARSLSLLRPLSAERLAEVVVEPAAVMGFSFESHGTVESLIAEARVAEGGLPLLQFALAELWEHRDPVRKVIPDTALTAIGGVAGALARHADGVVEALPSSDRAAARAILLSLVTSDGTRDRREHRELVEHAGRLSPRPSVVIDALVRGRLLVAHEAEAGGDSAYAIAHEALLTRWGTLRGWLTEDVEGRAARQRLERAAAEWERTGKSRDLLWNARQLHDVRRILGDALPAREQAFVEASRHAIRRRRLARWSAAIGIPALVGGTALAMHLHTVGERHAAVTRARDIVASANTLDRAYQALRAAAFAKFDAGASDADDAWHRALVAEPDVEQTYAAAGAELERILQDDPDLDDARSVLSDVLFARARLADLTDQTAQRDELVRRLAIYGSAARWKRPAHLMIHSTPAAQITLRRIAHVDGRWTASTQISRLQTNVDTAIDPGDVILELAAPGRETTHLPVRAAAGETLVLSVDLPPVGEHPDMAYVPAGRFLFGTSGGEDSRTVYASEPLHAVETPAYWIARNETTYGEWIAYLRAQSPEERVRRLPVGQRQGFGVALTVGADGAYRLALGPVDHPYIAREGEPLHYEGRTTRADVNWSRLPVTGISFDDVLAYTRWLDATGKLRGAHPCTEYEWERAARGADGRVYPHGERLAPDDANYDLTYGRVVSAFGPDEVGSHVASDSPYGVHDLAGNVWEWTASHVDARVPVGRGGSFFQVDVVERSDNRSPDIANRRDAHYGARVCASAQR